MAPEHHRSIGQDIQETYFKRQYIFYLRHYRQATDE